MSINWRFLPFEFRGGEKCRQGIENSIFSNTTKKQYRQKSRFFFPTTLPSYPTKAGFKESLGLVKVEQNVFETRLRSFVIIFLVKGLFIEDYFRRYIRSD